MDFAKGNFLLSICSVSLPLLLRLVCRTTSLFVAAVPLSLRQTINAISFRKRMNNVFHFYLFVFISLFLSLCVYILMVESVSLHFASAMHLQFSFLSVCFGRSSRKHFARRVCHPALAGQTRAAQYEGNLFVVLVSLADDKWSNTEERRNEHIGNCHCCREFPVHKQRTFLSAEA